MRIHEILVEVRKPKEPGAMWLKANDPQDRKPPTRDIWDRKSAVPLKQLYRDPSYRASQSDQDLDQTATLARAKDIVQHFLSQLTSRQRGLLKWYVNLDYFNTVYNQPRPRGQSRKARIQQTLQMKRKINQKVEAARDLIGDLYKYFQKAEPRRRRDPYRQTDEERLILYVLRFYLNQ